MRAGLRRAAVALAAIATVVALAGTAASAYQRPTVPGGSFRVDTVGASWQIDPAVGYITTAWQMEYATCAKLLNYPDAPHPEGSRLVPEIAAAMPTISPDHLTYTFQIRDDYAFSPPATGVVTAESMKWTFERTLSPNGSPAGRLRQVVAAEGAAEGASRGVWL